MDKLIDEIIELVLEDMDCHHEVDHEEDGVHTSVEYNLKDETKLREKIEALLKLEVTEEWIEEKAKLMSNIIHIAISSFQGIRGFNMPTEGELKNFIRSLVKKMPAICKDWLPTVENINALPEPVRNYIADIGTNADPPSMVADNIILRDTVKALEIKCEEKPTVDKRFIEEWYPAINYLAHSDEAKEDHKGILKLMLKEAGVEVVEK